MGATAECDDPHDFDVRAQRRRAVERHYAEISDDVADHDDDSEFSRGVLGQQV